MKRLSLIIVCSIILKIAASQSISPLQTDEYCPNTEYTFTATIPKTYSSMIGVGGCFVTQLPTPPVSSTFTFTDGTSYDFEFKKIKSLTGCSLNLKIDD